MSRSGAQSPRPCSWLRSRNRSHRRSSGLRNGNRWERSRRPSPDLWDRHRRRRWRRPGSGWWPRHRSRRSCWPTSRLRDGHGLWKGSRRRSGFRKRHRQRLADFLAFLPQQSCLFQDRLFRHNLRRLQNIMKATHVFDGPGNQVFRNEIQADPLVPRRFHIFLDDLGLKTIVHEGKAIFPVIGEFAIRWGRSGGQVPFVINDCTGRRGGDDEAALDAPRHAGDANRQAQPDRPLLHSSVQ